MARQTWCSLRIDFMARLAALVLTPRVNLTRYYGAMMMDWRAESPVA